MHTPLGWVLELGLTGLGVVCICTAARHHPTSANGRLLYHVTPLALTIAPNLAYQLKNK